MYHMIRILQLNIKHEIQVSSIEILHNASLDQSVWFTPILTPESTLNILIHIHRLIKFLDVVAILVICHIHHHSAGVNFFILVSKNHELTFFLCFLVQ